MKVEVVYGQAPGVARVARQDLPAGATLRQAIAQSGLLEACPEIDLEVNKVGVFNQRRNLDDPAQDGDRIEIYRPLQADPKETRRRRAQAGAQKRGPAQHQSAHRAGV